MQGQSNVEMKGRSQLFNAIVPHLHTHLRLHYHPSIFLLLLVVVTYESFLTLGSIDIQQYY